MVSAERYEAIDGNMFRFGLAAAGEHAKLGRRSTAAVRSGSRAEDSPPMDAY